MLMRVKDSFVLLWVVFFLAACAPAGEETTSDVSTTPVQSGLEGAWKITEVSFTSPDSSWTNTNPPPGLYFFTERYYSEMYARVAPDGTTQPRMLRAGEKRTDAEKVAAYDTITANAGTYAISGSTITGHVMVAKSPNYMLEGTSWSSTYEIEGDTLRLTRKNDAGTIATVFTLVRLR